MKLHEITADPYAIVDHLQMLADKAALPNIKEVDMTIRKMSKVANKYSVSVHTQRGFDFRTMYDGDDEDMKKALEEKGMAKHEANVQKVVWNFLQAANNIESVVLGLNKDGVYEYGTAVKKIVPIDKLKKEMLPKVTATFEILLANE